MQMGWGWGSRGGASEGKDAEVAEEASQLAGDPMERMSISGRAESELEG